MTNVAELFSEMVEAIARVDPISSAAQVNSAYVSVAKFHQIAAVINTGVTAATATFNAQVRQASDGAGTGVKVIPNRAGTGEKKITQIGDTVDSGLFIINIDVNELDINNGFDFVRLELIPATAAVLVQGILYGVVPRYKPAALTNVTEVIT